MPTGGPTRWPPLGYWELFRRARDVAAPWLKEGFAPERYVVLDAERVDEMIAVQQELAGKFIWTSDQAQYGQGDFWAHPTPVGKYLRGDCEDHALEARARLLERGWPASCMRLALCVLPASEAPRGSGRAHVVLTLEIYRDGHRTYVLDSFRPHLVMDWRDYRYRLADDGDWTDPKGQWIAREAPERFLWESIQ